MFSKRGVIRTDVIEQDIGTSTPPRDSGALSGILAGISFIGGVGGAMALADYPYPRLGSEPAEIRRYFTQSSHAARLSAAGQFVSAASLIPFTASVLRLAGRSGQGSHRLRAAAIAGDGLAAARAEIRKAIAGTSSPGPGVTKHRRRTCPASSRRTNYRTTGPRIRSRDIATATPTSRSS